MGNKVTWTPEDIEKKLKDNEALAKVNPETRHPYFRDFEGRALEVPTYVGGKLNPKTAPAFTHGIPMTEADLLECVLDAAARFGWLCVHFRPARVTRNGRETYETAYQGDKGFLDVCLARGGVVLLAELKSENGKVTEEQQEWLEASGGYLWRPSDWRSEKIIAMLR